MIKLNLSRNETRSISCYKKNDEEFLLGLKDMLICLQAAEKMNELPELPFSWWRQVWQRYDTFDV